jgi:hypothetical protein
MLAIFRSSLDLGIFEKFEALKKLIKQIRKV